MRAVEFKIPRDSGNTIHVQHDRSRSFYGNYHFHNELQLTLISQGSGTLYMGDSISRFEPGDIFLIGANLPHLFSSDEDSNSAESHSFFFVEDFLGKDYFSLQQSQSIVNLLNTCVRGLKINSNNHELMSQLICEGTESNELDQQVFLLKLLILASRAENIQLAGPAFSTPESQDRVSRISDILDYITSNSHRDISLEEIAETAFLTPTAFCRYFKQHTGKTFVQFTNEVRISKVCRRLLSGEDNIAQICFESGFSNLSNFNRTFKKQLGVSPKEYRKLTHLKS